MHLLNFFLARVDSVYTVSSSNKAAWLQVLTDVAPLFALLTSLANLGLALFVFSFSKQKNDNDRNIKWFQELIFTPNKELLFSYFKNIAALKEKIPTATDLTDDDRIQLINVVKAERTRFLYGFVDMIEPFAPHLHKRILNLIEKLTDDVTKAIDNDELKLNNERTYAREVEQKVSVTRNNVLKCVFEYTGKQEV